MRSPTYIASTRSTRRDTLLTLWSTSSNRVPGCAQPRNQLGEGCSLGAGKARERSSPAPPWGRARSPWQFAILRRSRTGKLAEPFAGLTGTETAAFSELIARLRAAGHAVLLVDHNVKSVSRLVDRVLAMYVGERIAEGSAEEVMRDETVRRRLPGRRPGNRRTVGVVVPRHRPLSWKSTTSGPVRQGAGLGRRLDPRPCWRVCSVVGLNGAGKTTLFNTISGLLPYSGEIRREGRPLRGLSAAAIARGGIVQCPEGRELFGDMTVREKPRPGRPASDARRGAASRSSGCSSCFRS